MKTENIKYKLSTDYERLLVLLNKGYIVVGFSAICIDNKVHKEYCRVREFKRQENDYYDIDGILEYKYFSIKDNFKNFCEQNYIKYFDIDK